MELTEPHAAAMLSAMRLVGMLVTAFALASAPAHAAEQGAKRAPAAKKATPAAKKKATVATPPTATTTPAPKARLAPGRRANMPGNWTWPPSDEMLAEGERCLRDLDRLGLPWEPAERDGRVTTPIVVPDMEFGGVRLEPRYGKGPWLMDCHLARALVRDVGPALRNMKVTTIRFGQIFKERDVAGKPGVLSRHALGMAMDVYAFVTEDGVEHVVLGGYVSGDEVLLEVERRVTDTGSFRALLTPGNDPRHHDDHFHFEARAAGDKVWTKPTRDVPEPSEDGVIVEVELEGPPAPRQKPVRRVTR